MNTIFVYGTLKRGFGLNSVLKRGGAKFVGEAVTVEPYFMADWGGCPALFRAHAAHPLRPISGEVYTVEDPALMDQLDRIESAYDRTEVDVTLDGKPMKVELYFGRSQYRNAIPAPVEDGRYVWQHKSERRGSEW